MKGFPDSIEKDKQPLGFYNIDLGKKLDHIHFSRTWIDYKEKLDPKMFWTA